MNINKSLSEWRRTKSLSLASEICEALVEMLEDEDCDVINSAPMEREDATVRFENDNHELVLIRQDRNAWRRIKVLEDEDGES